MKWLKKKTLKWLGLDYEVYIGVDIGMKSTSYIIIMKQNQDGTIDVIGDQNIKNRNYQMLLHEVWDIAKKYRHRKVNIIFDGPRIF